MRGMRREGAPQEKLRRCWRLIEMEAVSLISKEGQNMAEVVSAYRSISISRVTTIYVKRISHNLIVYYIWFNLIVFLSQTKTSLIFSVCLLMENSSYVRLTAVLKIFNQNHYLSQ